jgi:acetyl-CoA carboxylase carboxyl transferase subunit beta
LVDSETYARYRVCHLCGFHYSISARERIDSLIDTDTFHEINRSVTSTDPLSFSSKGSYKQRIFNDQKRTGLTEAVVTGTCDIGGYPAMLIVLDFGFMGGTMGCVVGEKVALAFEHAGKKKLPIIAIITSGGARIQEGVLSLMQMAKTSMAATQFGKKGLPFIAVLANPATGQTYASFGSLADIIVAEPGAIVGLSSLRAIKQSMEDNLPDNANTSETHLLNGLIDGVVKRSKLRTLLSVVLDHLGPQYQLTPSDRSAGRVIEPQQAEAWNTVQLARHESRPTSTDYISRIFSNFVELRGDRSHGDDSAIICGFGQLAAQTVVVIGQRSGKTCEGDSGGIRPEGFRKASRAVALAQKFNLPLITLIDTVGADVSLWSEEHGLGDALARLMADMGTVETPSISVVIGEGGSEGALSLGVADRVLMMENAIYTVISPEGAAELMFQDKTRVEEAAESLKLTAQDCRDYGIIDRIIQEPPGGAHEDPDEASRQLRRILLQELADLQEVSKRKMLRSRYKKFREMGKYSSRFRTAVSRETSALKSFVGSGVKRLARRQPDLPEDDFDLPEE